MHACSGLQPMFTSPLEKQPHHDPYSSFDPIQQNLYLSWNPGASVPSWKYIAPITSEKTATVTYYNIKVHNYYAIAAITV